MVLKTQIPSYLNYKVSFGFCQSFPKDKKNPSDFVEHSRMKYRAVEITYFRKQENHTTEWFTMECFIELEQKARLCSPAGNSGMYILMLKVNIG